MRRFVIPRLASLLAVAFIMVLAIGISDARTGGSIDDRVHSGH
jgi:hypothetical protein